MHYITIYTISIPVTDRDGMITQVRNAASLPHPTSIIPEGQRNRVVKALANWAQTDHAPHESLPHYAGRSYLKSFVDTLLDGTALEDELTKLGCVISQETKVIFD
jgi:hypothetical protein